MFDLSTLIPAIIAVSVLNGLLIVHVVNIICVNVKFHRNFFSGIQISMDMMYLNKFGYTCHLIIKKDGKDYNFQVKKHGKFYSTSVKAFKWSLFDRIPLFHHALGGKIQCLIPTFPGKVYYTYSVPGVSIGSLLPELEKFHRMTEYGKYRVRITGSSIPYTQTWQQGPNMMASADVTRFYVDFHIDFIDSDAAVQFKLKYI